MGVAYADGPTAATCSRYASAVHRIPPPEDGAQGFVAGIRRAVEEGGYEVAFPTGDAGVLALSAERQNIEICVPFAAHHQLLRALDKAELAKAARKVGFHDPKMIAASEETLASWSGPLVVKSRLHWDPRSPSDMDRLDPRFFDSPSDPRITQRFSYLRDHGAEPILQEHVEGRLMALSVVVDTGGKPLGAVQQESAGPWPSPPGSSLRARSVRVDPDLLARSLDLLRSFDWFGLAQLEFLRTRAGVPLLIDLNGRFYFTMPLAMKAGVNLPHLWGSSALGREITESPVAREGVRYHWIQGDLKYASELKGTRRLIETVRAFIYAIGAVSPVLSLRDPRPSWSWIRGWVRRRIARWKRH